jgi:NAD(P)-dependent dehydrogenase (short-subunit alcohol dehydrogenase family)
MSNNEVNMPIPDGTSGLIDFSDQVAVVTGAGRGLGAAYARLLAARGASVIVHDAGVSPDGDGFDPVPADEVMQQIVSDGGRAAVCYENLEQPAACDRVIQCAVDQFGRLDILIHNAGLVIFSEMPEMSTEIWNRMVNLGVHAPYHLIRAAIPLMRRQRYGRIVLTTSGRALRVSDCVPGLAGYSVGKMAQLGLMVAVAAENMNHGIHINAVSPVAATRVLRRHRPELLPELVAPGVAFLSSSACNESGVVLLAAGGRFQRAEWVDNEGIDFGKVPVGPEAICARWQDICGK